LHQSLLADNRPIVEVANYWPTDNQPVPYRCISTKNSVWFTRQLMA